MIVEAIQGSRPRNRKLIARLAGALTIASSLASVMLRHRFPEGSTASLVIALLPVPFLLFNIGVVVWSTRSCDELQRKIQFEALAFAYTCLFALVFLVISLQGAGHWKWFGMGEMMMATALLYAAGLLLGWNRYR